MSTMSKTDANISENKNNILITLLASICSLGPLATDMYLPALPQMTLDFSTTPSIIQLTLTSWLIGLAIGQVIAGPLSDIYGRTRPLVFGLIIFTISSVACIFAPSIELFIFARFIGGFAASSALVVSRAIASDIYKGTMLTKLLATIMIIQGFAPIIAPVLGGQLLRFFSWISVFVILTLAGIGITLLSLLKYKETLPEEKRLKGDIAILLKYFSAYVLDLILLAYVLFNSLFSVPCSLIYLACLSCFKVFIISHHKMFLSFLLSSVSV